MNTSPWDHEEDISFVVLGTAMLRQRWRIVRWAAAGGLIALGFALTRPTVYRATASFVPKGSESGSRAGGLASLAGQFGVAIPGGSSQLSPDFYAELLKSRSIYARVIRDTLTVAELGGRRIAFRDLFELPSGSPERMAESANTVMNRIVSTSVDKATGIVQVAVATRWPSVSATITGELIDAVNAFNLATSQGQAVEERKFLEGRLLAARDDLRLAEDRLETFLKANRQFASSPDLSFSSERLRREVTLQQTVFTSLTQSYQDARIRELRDMPTITMIESPVVPTIPQPRKRLISLIAGLLIGGFMGTFLAIMSDTIRRRRESNDSDVVEFVDALHETTGAVFGKLRRLRARAGD